MARFLREAEAAAHRLQAQAPRAREPTRLAAGRLRRRPVAAAAAAARGRSRRAPLPPTEFLSPRRTRRRKRLERTRLPPQGLELRGRGRCSREAPAPAPPKLSPPFPSRAQSAARGAAGTRRALSVSRESCGLRGSGFLSPTLPGCGEPRRRLHGRGTAAVTAKLPAAQTRRPTGVPARGDRPARVRALRSTILARCARAAGTAASPAKPASGQERGRQRRRAARGANGRAGAPVGGGCGAPGRTGVR